MTILFQTICFSIRDVYAFAYFLTFKLDRLICLRCLCLSMFIFCNLIVLLGRDLHALALF